MPSRRYSLLALTFLSLAACERPAAEAPPAPAEAPAPPSAPTPATQPPPPVPAHPDAGAAPVAFRGEWNADPAACEDDSGDTRLVIDARQMQFYEGLARIVAVKPRGPGEAVFETRLSSEGETVDFSYRFRLSPDGGTLTDVDNGGLARKRCPG